MKALVLSGGGLWGAWQAGVWSVLQERFEPDLIVGASIGSLNGYLIASGASREELIALWKNPGFRQLGNIGANLQRLTQHYTLRRPFALTVTEILGLKGRIYRDEQITWRHLAASCAVPPVMPQVKLEGRWYTDGGLLAPLPVWAAAELGATEMVGLQVLGRFPSPWLGPLVSGFRRVAGKPQSAPVGTRLLVVEPSEKLGGLKSTLWGTQTEVERWIELGVQDGKTISI